MLQYVGVLQCVGVCWSVLQYVAVCVAVCCSVLQCVAVCVAVCCSVLGYLAQIHVDASSLTRVHICVTRVILGTCHT